MTPLQKALKTNLINALIFAGISLPFIVLLIILQQAWLLFFIFITLACAVAIILDRKRIRRMHCTECGEKYNYKSDVAWEVADVFESNNKIKSTVEFKCVCRNCNKTKEFKNVFTTASIDKDGKKKVYNIENLAKKYCR